MAWVFPIAGACPRKYPVKVNADSGIYHLPGDRYYHKVDPERCFMTGWQAGKAGFRPAQW